MQTPPEKFLFEVESFLERSKMPASAFGWEAIKDPNFVRNLRAGREPRFNTAQRVRDFMAAQSEHAQ